MKTELQFKGLKVITDRRLPPGELLLAQALPPVVERTPQGWRVTIEHRTVARIINARKP